MANHRDNEVHFYFLQGLRISVLIGAIGTCVGAWMKVVAVHPNRFWLVLLSQCTVAMFQVLVLPVPPKLAAVWFGPNEIALACTIAAVALQVREFLTAERKITIGLF